MILYGSLISVSPNKANVSPNLTPPRPPRPPAPPFLLHVSRRIYLISTELCKTVKQSV